MDNCLFCKIIKKEIPSEIIYEDKDIMVFLDIRPTTNGDSLVVPKEHFETMFDVPRELLNYMEECYQHIYEVYKKKLKCDGLTLATNFDYAQEIKHFHMHFIPRYKNDDFEIISDKSNMKDLKEIQKIIND